MKGLNLIDTDEDTEIDRYEELNLINRYLHMLLYILKYMMHMNKQIERN